MGGQGHHRMSTTGDKSPHTQVGRKVLMVGGPDAGRIRVVPESAGEYLMGQEDWVYRIFVLRFPDSKEPIHFAYAANEPIGKLFIDLWREYSPAIQIKGDEKFLSYQKLRRQPSST